MERSRHVFMENAPLSLISTQMMTAQQRPTARRGPSGAWSRLKAPAADPLEVYGLPSKGETRLNDFKTQETFYNKIVERYMKFCAASGGGDELERQFAGLSLASDANTSTQSADTKTTTNTSIRPAAARPRTSSNTLLRPSTPSFLSSTFTPTTSSTTTLGSTNPTASRPSPTELPTILSAMRVLREAIVSSHRTDHFAQRAYLFIIHAAILVRSWEAYHPALLYLLRAIHPATPLSPPELGEVLGYMALDLGCRVGDLSGALGVAKTWGRGGQQVSEVVVDGRVEGVLRALVRDDWVGFWRLRREVDGYVRCLMGWAEEGVRVHALKCLGRSYLSADRAFVERCAGGMGWAELVREGVGWELVDGERVVIRRPKVR